MSEKITECEIVAFKTVFPETKRLGVVPGTKSDAYKAIQEIRGEDITKEDMQPWLNAPVLVFYDTVGSITHVIYRATCLSNDIENFWKPQICLFPVKAYYTNNMTAMESGRCAFSDTEKGVADVVERLEEEGITVDIYAFTEALKKLKTERIFYNRWSTLCCGDIELIKTGWHIGSYYDMFMEVLLATKNLDNILYLSSVAVTPQGTEEKEWFYLIPAVEVRYALSEVPTTMWDLLKFGVAAGLCIENQKGEIVFTNSANEYFYAFSKAYMDDYRRCLKGNPEFLERVFPTWTGMKANTANKVNQNDKAEEKEEQ